MKSSLLSSSSPSFPLKLALQPSSQGLPASIESVLTPILESHARTALAVNSEP